MASRLGPPLLAVITTIVLTGCALTTVGGTTTTSATAGVTSRLFELDEQPQSDDGPLCWMTFANGVREGGCRNGTLHVVEYSNNEGTYVEGWHQVTSHIAVPQGWDVYTYHQMWADGEEDMAKRQGYIHHPSGTTSAFYQETHQVVRYGPDYDWQYCRTWNQDAINANDVHDEDDTNDTVQCLHIEPDTTQPDGTLIVAADHPAGDERLEITYEP